MLGAVIAAAAAPNLFAVLNAKSIIVTDIPTSNSGSAGIKLLSTGRPQTGSSSSNTKPTYVNDADEYLTIVGAGLGDDWEARLDVTSGTLDIGSTGTWQANSTERDYRISVNPATFTKTFTGTRRIRRIGDTAEVTAPVTLSLTHETPP